MLTFEGSRGVLPRGVWVGDLHKEDMLADAGWGELFGGGEYPGGANRTVGTCGESVIWVNTVRGEVCFGGLPPPLILGGRSGGETSCVRTIVAMSNCVGLFGIVGGDSPSSGRARLPLPLPSHAFI
eukprot:Hpha_TRINITY_DN16809_c0_g2::TRINITY_DN16809_c0_g2_i1::g.151794::m.151794